MTGSPDRLSFLPELPIEIAEIWRERRLEQEKLNAKKQPILSKLKSRVREMDEAQSRGESSLLGIIASSDQETAVQLLDSIEEASFSDQTKLLELSEIAISERVYKPKEVVELLEFGIGPDLFEVLLAGGEEDGSTREWNDELIERSGNLHRKLHGSEAERQEVELVCKAGVVIKALRQGQGITPEVAAAYLDVDPGFIAFLENGLLSLDEIYPQKRDQLANALDVDPCIVDLMFKPSTWEKPSMS